MLPPSETNPPRVFSQKKEFPYYVNGGVYYGPKFWRGSIYLENNVNVKDLNKLVAVGQLVYSTGPQDVSLDNLEKVQGLLDISGTLVKSLPKLNSVGTLRLNRDIEELPNLTHCVSSITITGERQLTVLRNLVLHDAGGFSPEVEIYDGGHLKPKRLKREEVYNSLKELRAIPEHELVLHVASENIIIKAFTLAYIASFNNV